jgi:hypothetical protein
MALPDTVYGAHSTQTRLQSETADNIAWGSFTQSSQQSQEVHSALTRIKFEEASSAKPLRHILESAGAIATQCERQNKPLFVVAGRSRRMAVESHKQELLGLVAERNMSLSSESPKTFGEIGAAFIATGANVSLMVVQASASA